MVDDFYSVTWAFFINCKHDVFQLLEQFFALVATKFRARVTSIQMDNATNFLKLEFSEFFFSNGKIHLVISHIHHKKMV